MRAAYLKAGPQTVGVVSSVTAVTQQHVVGVSFASADATAGVEDRARPEDALLQAGQVYKHLETSRQTDKSQRDKRTHKVPVGLLVK